jgi:hypothetical protein
MEVKKKEGRMEYWSIGVMEYWKEEKTPAFAPSTSSGLRRGKGDRMKNTGIVEGWKDGGKKSLGDRRPRRSP